MITFNEEFFVDCGLADLPEEQRESFISYAYEHLELRTGEEIAKTLDKDQLDLFDALLSADDERIAAYLDVVEPGWRLMDHAGLTSRAFAHSVWLGQNVPNYAEIVHRVFEELKVEIRASAASILAAATPGGSPGPLE